MSLSRRAANVIISVRERRSEIGLRPTLGATHGQIRAQFLSEAILLALIGGASGVAIRSLATTVYAHTKHWAVVSRDGTRTPSRSSGPKPPSRSSNQSNDFSNESTAEDTSCSRGSVAARRFWRFNE